MHDRQRDLVCGMYDHALRALGKPEQLVSEMEGFKMSVLAATKTHLTKSRQMVLDEVKGYKMLLSWRQDGKAAE